MSSTDLYRLTGIKDKDKTGLAKIKIKYEKLLEYINACSDVDMIFDRTFFTEEIYSRLGFKNYSFTKEYNKLLKILDKLNYEIYIIYLYLENEKEYKKRIKRDKHQYQNFAVESSLKQQEEYKKLFKEVEKTTKNIKIIRFNNTTQCSKPEYEKRLKENFEFLFKEELK